mmetsp:Transcript_18864/g.44809  ORF Transcript_18864/g.44809 Transcript_18864/m.44809 type:complete len:305 (+) Transcript_18864:501-1415(+)
MGETRPSVKLEAEARRAARGANEVARRVTTGAPAVATAARLAAWARSGNSRKKRPNSASEIALVLSASSIWNIASKRWREPSSCRMVAGRPRSCCTCASRRHARMTSMRLSVPSPFLSMRRKASARSAQLSHAGWYGDMCLATEGRGAILIPASEDKVKSKSGGSGSSQNSDTLKSLGSVDDGGCHAAAESGGDSCTVRGSAGGSPAGGERAKEHRRQSAVSRAVDGGAGEGELCPARAVGNRCGSGRRGASVASHAAVVKAWVSRAAAAAVSARGEERDATMMGGGSGGDLAFCGDCAPPGRS